MDTTDVGGDSLVSNTETFEIELMNREDKSIISVSTMLPPKFIIERQNLYIMIQPLIPVPGGGELAMVALSWLVILAIILGIIYFIFMRENGLNWS